MWEEEANRQIFDLMCVSTVSGSLFVCWYLVVVCWWFVVVFWWFVVACWWFMVVFGGLWSLPVLGITSSSLQTIVFINTWLRKAIIIFVI